MAVDEKEDFKGRRKRNSKHVADEARSLEILKNTFPVNVTVDELYLYRKKKHTFAWLKDNLKVEEGSFKHLKSEYTRRFKNFFDILKSSINRNEKDLLAVEVLKPEDTFELADEQKVKSVYNESFNRHLQKKDDGIGNVASNNEILNRIHPFGTTVDKLGRPRLSKRPTTLKIEGDYCHVTEYAEQFIEFLLAKRSELCRTPTNLKLGTGEMETKTETTDQFRKFDNAERPTLIRKFTNLRLEGELDVRSEKQEKFQRYEINSKPPLVKNYTNLHLEGNYSLMPEYRHQYVEYRNVERPEPILPSDNLKTACLFENTNKNTKSTNFERNSSTIPFLRSSYSYHDLDEAGKSRRNISSSNISLNRTSSHTNLVKSALADDRSARKLLKSPSPRRFTDLTKEPEYKSASSEVCRGRSRMRKPENNFVIGGDVNYVTEKEDKFIRHKGTQRRKSLRRKSGNIFNDPIDRLECQPEYRKAIRDYMIREKLPPGQKRRILEIPDITIDSDSKENEETGQKATTSPDKSSIQKPSSSKLSPTQISSAAAAESSKLPAKSTTQTLRRNSKINTETVRLSPDKKERVYRRSSTPSPIAKEKTACREQSPMLGSSWRKSEPKLSETSWNSTETDPAFFIVNDDVPDRRSVRRNLYKEQRWMPAWYSGEL